MSRKGTTMKCSICKEKGHNIRRCTRIAGGSKVGGRDVGASGSQQQATASASGSQQQATATPKRTKTTASRLTPTK